MFDGGGDLPPGNCFGTSHSHPCLDVGVKEGDEEEEVDDDAADTEDGSDGEGEELSDVDEEGDDEDDNDEDPKDLVDDVVPAGSHAGVHPVDDSSDDDADDDRGDPVAELPVVSEDTVDERDDGGKEDEAAGDVPLVADLSTADALTESEVEETDKDVSDSTDGSDEDVCFIVDEPEGDEHDTKYNLNDTDNRHCGSGVIRIVKERHMIPHETLYLALKIN